MSKQLNDIQVKNAKPKDNKYTISAGHGLTLLVMPDGAKYWRFRYNFGGKPKAISVGRPYPETTLKEAVAETVRLRSLLASGSDPAEERALRKLAQRQHVANTFGQAAEAWHSFRSQAWSQRTAEQVREYLDKDLLPKLRARPLNAVASSELGLLIAGIEGRGAFDVAKKTRQWLKSIFAYARAKGWTSNDPARDLAAIAAKAPAARNYPHIEKEELPAFLAQMAQVTSASTVKGCLMLALWLGNRPGVTRTLKWSELDLESGIWEIAKGRELMKRGYRHTTPLPRQAVAMLHELREVSGSFEYVFIGRNDPRKPLSDGAVNGLIERMGYRGKQCTHGFRHVLSTCMNELGYEPEWIERQLSHGDPDAIRGTYNKAVYLPSRREMLQDWADVIERMQAGESWEQVQASVLSRREVSATDNVLIFKGGMR
jgi:integrase